MNFYAAALKFFGIGNNYERYLTSTSEGVGHINLQTIYNFSLAFGTFLLGYYVLVWEKKPKKHLFEKNERMYSLATKESFLLYMVLIAATFNMLIFRMNILNRFSLYFTPFILILCPYAISAMKLKSNKPIARKLIYFVFGFYFVWLTITKAAEFYGVVPYRFM